METFCSRLGWVVFTWTLIAIPLLCGFSWGLHWNSAITAVLTILTMFEFLLALLLSIDVIKDKE